MTSTSVKVYASLHIAHIKVLPCLSNLFHCFLFIINYMSTVDKVKSCDCYTVLCTDLSKANWLVTNSCGYVNHEFAVSVTLTLEVTLFSLSTSLKGLPYSG